MKTSIQWPHTKPLHMLALLIILFAACEGIIRMYLHFRPFRHRIDKRLGWRTVENYTYRGYARDATGHKYELIYTTNQEGFRAWGDPQSKRKKLLVLGNSITQAAAVSDDRTYYGILKKHLPIELFAYGAGGYGTLQEYMILDEYYDRLRPDFVIWEFASNDLFNNDFALERSSRGSNGLLRPYLAEDGQILYAIPSPFPLLRRLGNFSRLLYLNLVFLDKLNANWGRTVEMEIATQGEQHVGLQRSARVTEKIVQRVRLRCDGSHLLAFCIDDVQPYSNLLQRIAERNGMEWIEGIPQAISEAETRGIVTTAADRGHWNEIGHSICAKKIIEHFERKPGIFHEDLASPSAGKSYR